MFLPIESLDDETDWFQQCRLWYANYTIHSSTSTGLVFTVLLSQIYWKLDHQGGHGCLVIPFDKGICGAAATTGETQDVPDVHARPEHIACSSSTLSEVVVPVKDSEGNVVAVLDLDSDLPAAFSSEDIEFTEQVCEYLGKKYF